MMASHRQSDEALLEQSATDELRRNARAGMAVEVRGKHSGTLPEKWTAGKVDRVVSRGVFVNIGPNKGGFYPWSQVRRPAPPSSPNATLGDLVLYRQAKRPPNYTKPLKPVSAAPSSPPAPTPPKSEPPPPEPTPKVRKRRETHAHEPTLIGDEFRRWRRTQNKPQADAAAAVGISTSRWCAIELGDELPSDDVLQGFADRSGLDLLALIDLRAQGPSTTALTLLRQPEAAPEPVVEAVFEPPPEPAPVPAPSPTPPSPPPPSDEVSGFVAFTEAMEEVAPMPIERTLRKRWFSLIKELYEVTRCT